jgi:site-specific DNA-methyltransferase (adenine-specific)
MSLSTPAYHHGAAKTTTFLRTVLMKTEKIGRATIHNMDCMDFLKGCDDNQFDLAIVDPPYGININESMGRRKGQKHSGHKKAYWDNKTPTAEYFKELRRVSVNQIIWGGNYMTENLPPSPCWILWDKGFSEKVSFAQYEMAWSSFKTSAKKYNQNPNQSEKIHPTQKPVTLYEWLLSNYAKEGDSILDTHMGSGSIAIATNKHGFDLTACELDKDYFKAACERVRQANNQPDMFTPTETKPEQAELL